MWKVYLDTCCLNRPFNDRSQVRIRREADAVLIILEHFARRDWLWISSEAVSDEVDQIPDRVHRLRVTLLANDAHEHVLIQESHARRASELEALGFKSLDALHLACAEAAGADVLLTTDDRLLRAARRLSDRLLVRVLNPVDWLEEVANQ